MEPNKVYGSNPQLWHACAGNMVQMPTLNSNVFYFAQGHAENASGPVDFGNHQIPSMIRCKVSAINYMADTETDEVYAKMRLVPLMNNDFNFHDDDDDDDNGNAENEKPDSFAKTLTQSDANNGGGFSVPRNCADMIFPRLNYEADPPVQNILAKDVHGYVWQFRHIYRGTPRRHLLTTGWSNFVNKKKLVAGDSIVFLRAENGDLCVGVRRAKRGGGHGNVSDHYLNPKSKVKPECVIQAANLAANRLPFEVVYDPLGSSSASFCVKVSTVLNAMRIKWRAGLKFKMAFEIEDSPRVSWFIGVVNSVELLDPISWLNSPWKMLEVGWVEKELLKNVKRVSPWLVELVPNIPPTHLTPCSSPPRKKMRVPQHSDFSLINEVSAPPFSDNLLPYSSQLCSFPDNSIPTSIQGARQPQYGLSLSDLNQILFGLFPVGFQRTERPEPLSGIQIPSENPTSSDNNEDISRSPTIGNPSTSLEDDNKKTKGSGFYLFGKLIEVHPQNSENNSNDDRNDNTLSEKMLTSSDDGFGSVSNQNGPRGNSSDEGSPCSEDQPKTDTGLDIETEDGEDRNEH